MDTEGLGSLEQGTEHDTRIFSLAILLSSYFCYNSMGTIDNDALNQLNLVANLTKHIQIKAGDASGQDRDASDFTTFFPSFMWVVRDFELQLTDD